MAKKIRPKWKIKGPGRPKPGVGKSVPGSANGGHNNG